MERNTAVPSVPPICRVKVAVAVATPICCGGTAFCTARVSGWKLKPRPTPKKTMTTIVCQSGVSYATNRKAKSDSMSSAAPMTGNFR